ncbi:oligosaccharide flippase family protein [Vicingaceae bacterium]|nr:oligosaccharide flippase family protein [Vicingaceae bacterium]
MINRFKSILDGRASVFKNFLALGILQGTNFLIPLIIMPYLVTTIGIENYGIVGIIQALMVYFYSITDYGFLVSATRELATANGNLTKIGEVFNKVFFTKMLLLVVAALLLALLVFLIPDLTELAFPITLGFAVVVGQTLLPVWFFQGVEKMKYLAYVNLFAKIIFTILIFVFVKQESDFYLVLLFLGLGNVVSGSFGLLFAVKQYSIVLTVPSIQEVKSELKLGWEVFLANFSIITYMSSNILILGIFASNLIVGYYNVVEKIVVAMRQILVIFSQAIYPHICQLAKENHSKVQLFFKQIFIPFLLLFLFASIIVFFFAEEVVFIFSKSSVPEIVNLLRWLVFLPFVVALNIPSYQTMLAYGFQNSCSRILVAGSIVNVGLNFILAPTLLAEGTAISVIVTELFITVGLNVILIKRHPLIKLSS